MGNDAPVSTFRGKPLADMTREELIEAVMVMARLYNKSLEVQRETATFYRDLMGRRGG